MSILFLFILTFFEVSFYISSAFLIRRKLGITSKFISMAASFGVIELIYLLFFFFIPLNYVYIYLMLFIRIAVIGLAFKEKIGYKKLFNRLFPFFIGFFVFYLFTKTFVSIPEDGTFYYMFMNDFAHNISFMKIDPYNGYTLIPNIYHLQGLYAFNASYFPLVNLFKVDTTHVMSLVMQVTNAFVLFYCFYNVKHKVKSLFLFLLCFSSLFIINHMFVTLTYTFAFAIFIPLIAIIILANEKNEHLLLSIFCSLAAIYFFSSSLFIVAFLIIILSLEKIVKKESLSINLIYLFHPLFLYLLYLKMSGNASTIYIFYAILIVSIGLLFLLSKSSNFIKKGIVTIYKYIVIAFFIGFIIMSFYYYKESVLTNTNYLNSIYRDIRYKFIDWNVYNTITFREIYNNGIKSIGDLRFLVKGFMIIVMLGIWVKYFIINKINRSNNIFIGIFILLLFFPLTYYTVVKILSGGGVYHRFLYILMAYVIYHVMISLEKINFNFFSTIFFIILLLTTTHTFYGNEFFQKEQSNDVYALLKKNNMPQNVFVPYSAIRMNHYEVKTDKKGWVHSRDFVNMKNMNNAEREIFSQINGVYYFNIKGKIVQLPYSDKTTYPDNVRELSDSLLYNSCEISKTSDYSVVPNNIKLDSKCYEFIDKTEFNSLYKRIKKDEASK